MSHLARRARYLVGLAVVMTQLACSGSDSGKTEAESGTAGVAGDGDAGSPGEGGSSQGGSRPVAGSDSGGQAGDGLGGSQAAGSDSGGQAGDGLGGSQAAGSESGGQAGDGLGGSQVAGSESGGQAGEGLGGNQVAGSESGGQAGEGLGGSQVAGSESGGQAGEGLGGNGQGGEMAGNGNGGSAGTGTETPDCDLPSVLCVDDTAGPTQEYSDIQAAADDATAGDLVQVFPGAYSGFTASNSGEPDQPITYRGEGDGVRIETPAETGDGIRLENVSNVVLDHFTVIAPEQRCIAARGATPEEPMRNLVISRNRCENATLEGMYLSEVADSLVEDNEVDGAGVGEDPRSHCLYLANAGSDGTVIRNNRLHGCQASESNGIHFNGDLSVGGDGIISGLVVEGNIIYDNGQNGFNLDGVQNSVFRNNLVYGNQRNALRAYAIDAAEGPRGLAIVNNTFSADISGWALKFTEDLGGHVVFNNLLLGASGAVSMDASPDWASDYNLFSDILSADGEDSEISGAEWQALDFDPHGGTVAAEDLFVSPSDGDYRLREGTPAVDAGIAEFGSVLAPDHDAFGTPRPQGDGFDVGAHELAP